MAKRSAAMLERTSDAPLDIAKNHALRDAARDGSAGGAAQAVLLSTTYYYYNDQGNVTRVVTETAGSTQYTATRLSYARNGRAVIYALGETWEWDGQNSPVNYQIEWAKEFRYGSARQRYLVRELDPGGLMLDPPQYTSLGDYWSDYDGDEIYGDFAFADGSFTDLRTFEPGLGRAADPLGMPQTAYYHTDMIGTTRMMSDATGNAIDRPVFTAFGERISGDVTGPEDRYGYAGSWGYQDLLGGIPGGGELPGFLHVGHRYYDPASGRFLQRDPVGIKGGLNVYAYAKLVPTMRIDPDGLRFSLPGATGPPDKGFTDRFWSKVHYTAGWLAGKLGLSFWDTICAAIRWEVWERDHWWGWDESRRNQVGDIYVAGKGWVDAQL